jgi:hypothetical protein
VMLYYSHNEIRFLFFVTINKFVVFHVGTHGCASKQKANFQVTFVYLFLVLIGNLIKL